MPKKLFFSNHYSFYKFKFKRKSEKNLKSEIKLLATVKSAVVAIGIIVHRIVHR